MSNFKFILGLDIGGTKVEVSLIKLYEEKKEELIQFTTDKSHSYSLEIIDTRRIPTERDNGYEDVVKRIAGLVNSVLSSNEITVSDISSLGIGLPGSVDPSTQQMLKGNTNIFVGNDLKQDLLKALDAHFDVEIENDANCFALAESLSGSGQKHRDSTGVEFQEETSVGIILGTGVGGGILISGRLLKGKKGGGAEIGHTQLISKGFDCYCGRKGCVEQYLSGPGFKQFFTSKSPTMAEDPPSTKDIFKMAEENNPAAIKMINEYQDLLVQFLANLNNILDPDYFVLGGGLSNQDLIYKGLEEKLYKQTFLKESRPKVYQNTLGDSAGGVGAALLPFIEKVILK
ncbi:MAG: ROK family protein [Bacteriovoracaceae bacterium]|nr:ROK family protein [Bacteriovoracaceae bacterium]